MFLWPSPTRDAPVYAMEFVVFGPKPIVAVIDAVGLAGPHAAKMSQDALTAAHMRFVLPQADDPPPWYQDCRSGHDFFVRPTPEQMPTLGEAHHAVFDAVLGALLEAPGCARPEQHLASIGNYKRHHRENTPGLNFLERSFGADWTATYLEDWVFA